MVQPFTFNDVNCLQETVSQLNDVNEDTSKLVRVEDVIFKDVKAIQLSRFSEDNNGKLQLKLVSSIFLLKSTSVKSLLLIISVFKLEQVDIFNRDSISQFT